MKIAMIRVWQRLKTEGLKTKMILQVHDELNFSVPTEEKGRVEQIVKEEMQNAFQLAVPLIADGGWGKNWLEAH
jgi:DNA polymerase-1